MPGTPKDTLVSPTATHRPALDLLLRWLARAPGDHPPLGGLLAELADAFAAPAAGLAALPDGTPLARHPGRDAVPKLPWVEDPGLLARTREAANAVAVSLSAGGSLLFTTIGRPDGSGWLLWLEDPHRDGWDEQDAVALDLAGMFLGRWLSTGGHLPRWAEQLDRATRQRHLEIAAQCARRLAHDFGNVLTGIQGFTELALTQQAAAAGPLRSYLDEAFRGAQSGAQFTHQLRLFSRRQSASSAWCSLRPVLAEEEARLRPACAAGLGLQVSAPDDLPPLALDADHLRQVLAALLDNAHEALVGPGSVSVSARRVELTAAECPDLFGAAQPGPHVEICIADTGVGLTPEVQRRLFAEPFFTTKPGRRGFGLAVAYGILHAHRGGLRVHAGERGVVTRVLVPVAPNTLPATAAPAAEACQTAARNEKMSGASRTTAPRRAGPAAVRLAPNGD
jgi:signal transduction histidine kinase